MALQGSLLPSPSVSEPKEFQTQYWFGMLLAQAGLHPMVPDLTFAGRRPDFIVDLQGLRCGVEVKRPQSFRSARRALDRAASQLRDFGQPGLIALDLSDCLGGESLSVAALNSAIPIQKLIEPDFIHHSRLLGRRPVTYNQSNKYARIFMLACYARVVGWRRPDLSQPEGSFFLYPEVYPDACEGLILDYSRRMKDVLLHGLEAVSGSQAMRV